VSDRLAEIKTKLPPEDELGQWLIAEIERLRAELEQAEASHYIADVESRLEVAKDAIEFHRRRASEREAAAFEEAAEIVNCASSWSRSIDTLRHRAEEVRGE
jgi:hypothetical protein